MILEHLQYMTNVNIDVEPEHEDLPSFYWLPKLHKNPYGKRFIAASNKCTIKSLSKRLTTCLAKIVYFSPAKHFDSFDFSTLYTSIPHDSLKMALTSLVMETYRVRGNKYLVVDKYGNACWSDIASTASYI